MNDGSTLYSQIHMLPQQLSRPAQELLTSLALNCNTHSHEDIEVVSNLIRMRLKTKPLTNHYTSCIRSVQFEIIPVRDFEGKDTQGSYRT